MTGRRADRDVDSAGPPSGSAERVGSQSCCEGPPARVAEGVRIPRRGAGHGGGRSDRDGPVLRDAWDPPNRPEAPVPEPSPAAAFPSLHVSTHPAVLHKLAILRSVSTESPRSSASSSANCPGRSGTRRWPTSASARSHDRHADRDDRGAPAGRPDRARADPAGRPGHGRLDARAHAPAEVWQLWLFRDERTLPPVEYYNKLPDSATVDLCLIPSTLMPVPPAGRRRRCGDRGP